MMGAGPGHTFGGDNLHAAIYGLTKTGAVIDGMIRDLEGIAELPTQVYFRRAHPSAVAEVAVVRNQYSRQDRRCHRDAGRRRAR